MMVNAVHAQGGVVEDTEDVLSQIQQMGKCIPGVGVSTNTLESSPYGRECCEEAEKPRMRRVALHWITPMRGIQAEEELDILGVLLATPTGGQGVRLTPIA